MGPFSLRLARMIGKGQHEAAIEHLRVRLKGDASDAYALSMMAMLHNAAGRNDEAISLCHQTLAYDPQEFDAHAMLAQALAERGEHEAAAMHARKGLEAYPEPIEIPRFAIALYKAIARVIPRLRRGDIEKRLQNPDALNIEWFDWAKQYLHWYEETHGGGQTPSTH